MTSTAPGQPHLDPREGAEDEQTVTADGVSVRPTIEGVLVRPVVVHADERGEVVELLSEGWPEALGTPIPHVYLATIMPGVVKGWVSHRLQHDRTVVLYGRLRWVLYDGREDSPTVGMVQQIASTERNRLLVVVPPGVWHAVENIGTTEASFANMPTHAYRHDAPDKFRLPLDTPKIPFCFPPRR